MVLKETKWKRKASKKESTEQSKITPDETSHFSGTDEPAENVIPAVADDCTISPATNPPSNAIESQRRSHQGQTASEMDVKDFANMATLPTSKPPIVAPASAYSPLTHSKPLPDKGKLRPKDGKRSGGSSKSTIHPAVPILVNPRRQGQGASRTSEAPSTPASLGQKSKEGYGKKKDTFEIMKPQTNTYYGKPTGNLSITSQATLRPMIETTPGPSTARAKKRQNVHKAQKDAQHKIEESRQRQGTGNFHNDQDITHNTSPKDSEPRNPVDHGSFKADHVLAEFKFDGCHPRLRCPKPDCRAMTSCWDNNVVICPACGPDSFTRYCKKEHLFDDMQRHWAVECGRNKVAAPIDRDTIRPSQLPKRPYLTSEMPNMLERHRQAVYRAMEDADYFIFADLEEIDPGIKQPTPLQWNSVRGTGKVAFELRFFDDGSMYSETQYFNYHIQRVLSIGKAGGAEDSCLRAFSMIRNGLIRDGAWREEILSYLCMQLAGEWGDFKVPELFYNVAEVNTIFIRSQVLPALV